LDSAITSLNNASDPSMFLQDRIVTRTNMLAHQQPCKLINAPFKPNISEKKLRDAFSWRADKQLDEW